MALGDFVVPEKIDAAYARAHLGAMDKTAGQARAEEVKQLLRDYAAYQSNGKMSQPGNAAADGEGFVVVVPDDVEAGLPRHTLADFITHDARYCRLEDGVVADAAAISDVQRGLVQNLYGANVRSFDDDAPVLEVALAAGVPAVEAGDPEHPAVVLLIDLYFQKVAGQHYHSFEKFSAALVSLCAAAHANGALNFNQDYIAPGSDEGVALAAACAAVSPGDHDHPRAHAAALSAARVIADIRASADVNLADITAARSSRAQALHQQGVCFFTADLRPCLGAITPEGKILSPAEASLVLRGGKKAFHGIVFMAGPFGAYVVATGLNAYPLLKGMLGVGGSGVSAVTAAGAAGVINMDQIGTGTKGSIASMTLSGFVLKMLKVIPFLPFGTMIAASLMNAFGIKRPYSLEWEPNFSEHVGHNLSYIGAQLLIGFAHFLFTWFVQGGAERMVLGIGQYIAALGGNVAAQESLGIENLCRTFDREELAHMQGELLKMRAQIFSTPGLTAEERHSKLARTIFNKGTKIRFWGSRSVAQVCQEDGGWAVFSPETLRLFSLPLGWTLMSILGASVGAGNDAVYAETPWPLTARLMPEGVTDALATHAFDASLLGPLSVNGVFCVGIFIGAYGAIAELGSEHGLPFMRDMLWNKGAHGWAQVGLFVAGLLTMVALGSSTIVGVGESLLAGIHGFSLDQVIIAILIVNLPAILNQVFPRAYTGLSWAGEKIEKGVHACARRCGRDRGPEGAVLMVADVAAEPLYDEGTAVSTAGLRHRAGVGKVEPVPGSVGKVNITREQQQRVVPAAQAFAKRMLAEVKPGITGRDAAVRLVSADGCGWNALTSFAGALGCPTRHQAKVLEARQWLKDHPAPGPA